MKLIFESICRLSSHLSIAALAAVSMLTVSPATGAEAANSNIRQNTGLGELHRPAPRRTGAAPTAGTTGSIGNPIQYWGGGLLTNPTVYIIWYGNWNSTDGSDTPAGQQIIRDFLNSLGGSPYFNINQSYSIPGKTNYVAGKTNYTPGKTITGKLTFGGEYTDLGSAGLTLSDASMVSIVNTALTKSTTNSVALPYNPSGVYLVLTSAANVNYSGFCSSFCGWHTADVTAGGKYVQFGFVGNTKKCLSSCAVQSTVSPNSNPGVDGMISVIAHELSEAATDPDVWSGWMDINGYENADKCAWTFGTTRQTSTGAFYNVTLGSRNYLIQRNLKVVSPTVNYCVLQ